MIGPTELSALHSTEELRELIARVREERERAGRGDAPLQVVASCNDAFDVDGYRRLEDIGVTHLLTVPWVFYGADTSSLEDKRDGLKRFADEVIARM